MKEFGKSQWRCNFTCVWNFRSLPFSPSKIGLRESWRRCLNLRWRRWFNSAQIIWPHLEFLPTSALFLGRSNTISIVWKQLSRGVLKKRRSENMQQIYRRTLKLKRDFNKITLQFCLKRVMFIEPRMLGFTLSNVVISNKGIFF